MARIIFPPTGQSLPASGLSQGLGIAALLQSSKRRKGAVPLRRSFVQRVSGDDDGATKAPSPLSELVRSRGARALDLYLLVAAVTTAAPFDVTERSELWARCLGTYATGASTSVKISRLWRRLEDLALVARSQDGKHTKITKLMEDGSGAAYVPPSGLVDGPLQDIYFRLPFEYWSDELYEKLSLPAKAMLLICMSLRDPEFYIPDVFAEWYGLSPKTIRRGRHELVKAGILKEVGLGMYIDTSRPTLTATAAKYAFREPYNLNISKRAQAEISAAGPTKTVPGEGAPPALPPNQDESVLSMEFLFSKRSTL
ncbi:hypothetical protein [Kitasatospora sp. NPDC088548]|uniref:hypothetical protein n=1 Tax=Kitasatospora sp. NPDC088548 TaxID=3364075 RepID=UPI0037F7E845